MVKALVPRLLAAIGNASAAAIGYGLDFDEILQARFPWWIISIGVFVGLTMWLITDLLKANQRLLNARPSITVKAVTHDGCAYLEVHNFGDKEGDFMAEARVLATIPGPSLYTMFWQPCGKSPHHIDSDGNASILVGKLAPQDHITEDVTTTYIRGDVLLYKMGVSSQEIFPVYTGKPIVENRGDAVVYSSETLCKHIIEVTITSTPKLKEKWGTHRYIIEDDGGRLKFYDEPVNVS